jgi:HEAT repeat protein
MAEVSDVDSELASLDDATLLARASSEEDDELYWQLVRELHSRGTREICVGAIALCRGGPDDRTTGADVLGQLGFRQEYPFTEESLPILISLVDDSDDSVIDSAIAALGHLGDERGIDSVLGAAGHVAAEVRFSVASALPSLLGAGPFLPDDPAVAALIKLTTDPDSDVRDWATFGLGTQTNTDGEQVRAALLDRLSDSDVNTREEAMVGLAKRRDGRVLPYVLRALEDGEHTGLVLESASFLSAADLLPALRKIDSSDCAHSERLAMAIRRCDPTQQAAEVRAIKDLLASAAAVLPGVEVTLSCDLFGDGDVAVNVGSGSRVATYDFDRLLERAGGSVAEAVERIAEDNGTK